MEVIDLSEEEKVIPTEMLEEETKKEEVIIKTKKVKKEKFKKIKLYFSNLTKRQKIILGVILFLIIALIVVVCILFFNKEEEKTVFIEEEIVVLEMGNYKYIDGVLYFYDSEDNELGSYECIIKDEESCALATSEVDENLDLTVSMYEDETLLKYYMPIYDNYVFILDEEKLFLYDLSASEIVEEYDSVTVGHSNYVILSSGSKYALANFDEEFTFVTDFEYDYIGYSLSSSNFVFIKTGDYGIMNSDGEQLIGNISGEVVNYSDSAIVVLKNNEYSALNYENITKISDYEFIKLYDDYIYGFKDGLVYAYNNSFSKINEVGITVSEIDDYTDYDIYDENSLLISSDRLVTYRMSNEYSLVINNNNYFNTYETKLNEKYDYMNYIDGVIYIYNDLEKEELLGSYVCTYENNVTSETTEYTSCFIANHTNLMDLADDLSGVSPIIYSNYVFVYDTQTSAANSNIALYDLSNSETLSSYTNIDLLSVESYESNITKYDLNEFIVLAKKTNGSLGVIKINSSSASGLISFSYESITYSMEDYFLAKDSEGNQALFDMSGNEILSSEAGIKNEILDYSYGMFVVSVNNQKQLYSTTGTIVTNAYDEIIMEYSMYVGICSDGSVEAGYYDSSAPEFIFENIDYSSIEIEEKITGVLNIYFYDEDGVLIDEAEVSVE